MGKIMRKTILFGALTLAATTAAADAATTVALNGFCNAYQIRHKQSLYSVKDGGCSTGFGTGLLATVRGEGKTVIVALQDPTSSHTVFQFKFAYPFVTGGNWSLYDTTDGKTSNLIFSGQYTVPAGGQPMVKGARSITSRN